MTVFQTRLAFISFAAVAVFTYATCCGARPFCAGSLAAATTAALVALVPPPDRPAT